MQEKYQDIYSAATTDTAKINLKKHATIFGGLLLFGILLGFVPVIYKAMIVNKIGLKPGSEIREFYTKPIANYFTINVFNVTNKDEVINGAKPRLQEIGPFVFEEWKEKFDIIDDEENDTLTFNTRSTFIFRSDLTDGITMFDVITTAHPVIMGIALSCNVDRKPMLPLANKAIDAIFQFPKDPFWTGQIKDYLFDGIEIDCTSDNFAAKAVCSIFETGDVQTIQPLRQDFFKFSVFGAMNGSDIGMYKVHRGSRQALDVGRVISFNNKTEMDKWDGDECNQYNGTDGTIFPPGLNSEDALWAYEPNLCVSMGVSYVKDSNYQGIPTTRFGLDFGDAAKNEKLQCYCYDPPMDCPRRGTMNLFQCVGAPVVLSLPHFYNADPTLLIQIESGLIPNEKDHAFYIDYETITGSQIDAAKRLQFNLDVVPIKEVESMKNLPEVVLPLLWVEETAPLSNNHLVLHHELLLLVKILQWLAIITGTAGTVFSGYMYFAIKNVKAVATITED